MLLLHHFSRANKDWLSERLAPFYEILDPPAFDEVTLSVLAEKADVALGSAMASSILARAERLRLLQTPGAGLDKLDNSIFLKRNITVCNSVSHAPQVAEHALAMLLALMRKLALHDRLLRDGVWYRPQGNDQDDAYQTDSLSGATIGLVGYGAINQSVARLLSGFDAKFLVCARQHRPNVKMSSLNEIMMSTDAVIVALPLTEETRGMIGPTELGLKIPGPYLVNVGRAEVIDRVALAQALEHRCIRGAALDVPYDGADNLSGLADFTHFDNVLLSPHRAGTLRGASPHLLDVVANLTAFAQGLPLKNVVDLSVGY